MTTVTTLEDLFLHELKDIYHAEKQLANALPKLAKAAFSDRLRDAISQHLEETKLQIECAVAMRKKDHVASF